MEVAQTRIRHFTPLRYPGGKAKLASFIKKIIEVNGLTDGEYVEPYAGGAAIALELLFHEFVSEIHINDASLPIYAFWHSVLTEPEALCRLVVNTSISVDVWDTQKSVLRDVTNKSLLEVGFATFYLNRTNRSGILNGGIIGGRDQTGPWKIDARYNSSELARRIEAIAAFRERIKLTKEDAFDFVTAGANAWPMQTLLYLDPPYFVKGRDLYLDFYEAKDHKRIADLVTSIRGQHWIVSYDNVDQIRTLYSDSKYITYDIGYSARRACVGSEVMFFSESLNIPAPVGPIQVTGVTTQSQGGLWLC